MDDVKSEIETNQIEIKEENIEKTKEERNEENTILEEDELVDIEETQVKTELNEMNDEKEINLLDEQIENNKEIYILSDDSEKNIIDKYKTEFGNVNIEKNLSDVFSNELEGKDLKIIVEKDLLDDSIVDIPKNLNSFHIEGRRNGVENKNIINTEMFKLNGVESSFYNIGERTNNLQGDIIGAGPGYSTKIYVENSGFDTLWGVDSNISDSNDIGDSYVDIEIRDSKLHLYESIASINNKSKDVKYDINFKSYNTDYRWGLNPGINYASRGISKSDDNIDVKLGNINIDIRNGKVGSKDYPARGIESIINQSHQTFKQVNVDGEDINIFFDNVETHVTYPILVNSTYTSINANFKNVNVDIENSNLSDIYTYKFTKTVGNKDKVNIDNYKLNISNNKNNLQRYYIQGYVNNREKTYIEKSFFVKNPIDVTFKNVTAQLVYTSIFAANQNKEFEEIEFGDIIQNNNLKLNLINSDINTIEDGRNIKNTMENEIIFDNTKIGNIIQTPMKQNREYYKENGVDKYKDKYGFYPVEGDRKIIFKNNDSQRINNLYGATSVDLKNVLLIESGVSKTEEAQVNLIDDENWNNLEIVIATNPNIKIKGNEFIQAWKDDDFKYSLFYLNPDEVGSHAWILAPKITLHGNGGKINNKEKEEIRVLEKNKNIKDFEIDALNNDENYEFIGWTVSKDGKIEEDENQRLDYNTSLEINENINLYAKWKKIENYNLIVNDISYNVNDKITEDILKSDIIKIATINEQDSKEKVEIKFIDENINIDNLTEKEGLYEVELKLGNKKEIVKISINKEKDKEESNNREQEDKITNSKSSKKRKKTIIEEKNIKNNADFKEKKWNLEKINNAYILGYEDKTINPEGKITREEVATIFYRLLDENEKKLKLKEENNFKDVSKDRWSNNEISTLVNMGIINGYSEEVFAPDRDISRAEVMAMVSRFKKIEEEGILDRFNDVKSHWAEKYINKIISKGWINGYPDGEFKPDQEMTRAEFITLVNKMLERNIDSDIKLEVENQFKDLDENAWYYEDIIEATTSYKIEKSEDGLSKRKINL